MARRHLRTFTLSEALSITLDQLAEESLEDPRLKLLLPRDKAPSLDTQGLSAKDYEDLYRLLPSKTPNIKLPRTTDARTFAQHHTQCGQDNTFLYTKVLREMNRRINLNKHAVKPPLVNASRVADALMELGLAALTERVSTVERVEGSARKNAGEGKNKLPLTKRYKDTSVRTLP